MVGNQLWRNPGIRGRWLRRLGFLALIGTGFLAAQRADSDPQDPELISPWAQSQRTLVAHLTGHRSNTGEKPLGIRSSLEERRAAASYLVKALNRLGLQGRRHDYRLKNINGLVDLFFAPYRGTNVYARLPATIPSHEVVVMGAHYDSEPGSPGAVDNASGVALVYALAQRLSKEPHRPLNYLFVFFDQEEDNEVGSRAFARWLKKQDQQVHSVHITDLVGWDEDGDRAVEIQSPGPYLEQQYRRSALRLGLPLAVTRGQSSDNKSFLAAGYRTVGVWEEWDHGDSTPHLHRSTDTYETVNFEYLASTTNLVFEVVRQLEPSGEP